MNDILAILNALFPAQRALTAAQREALQRDAIGSPDAALMAGIAKPVMGIADSLTDLPRRAWDLSERATEAGGFDRLPPDEVGRSTFEVGMAPLAGGVGGIPVNAAGQLSAQSGSAVADMLKLAGMGAAGFSGATAARDMATGDWKGLSDEEQWDRLKRSALLGGGVGASAIPALGVGIGATKAAPYVASAARSAGKAARDVADFAGKTDRSQLAEITNPVSRQMAEGPYPVPDPLASRPPTSRTNYWGNVEDYPEAAIKSAPDERAALKALSDRSRSETFPYATLRDRTGKLWNKDQEVLIRQAQFEMVSEGAVKPYTKRLLRAFGVDFENNLRRGAK